MIQESGFYLWTFTHVHTDTKIQSTFTRYQLQSPFAYTGDIPLVNYYTKTMNSQKLKSTDNIQSVSLTFSCYMSYYYKVLTVSVSFY